MQSRILDTEMLHRLVTSMLAHATAFGLLHNWGVLLSRVHDASQIAFAAESFDSTYAVAGCILIAFQLKAMHGPRLQPLRSKTRRLW